jgi:hypothetical protein
MEEIQKRESPWMIEKTSMIKKLLDRPHKHGAIFFDSPCTDRSGT